MNTNLYHYTMWYTFMMINAIQSTIHCFVTDHSWLTRIYVTVNGFRSLFPVKVTERQCLIAFSSPLIDRTISTVSEICFAKQLSDSLYRPTWILLYAWAAEICCWFAVITKNNLFHVYEEYLWFLIGYTYYWYTPIPTARYVAALYCAYMLCVDIPMYAHRYLTQDPVSLIEGIKDMGSCYPLDEMDYTWRTGYFVGATRLSMYLDSMY